MEEANIKDRLFALSACMQRSIGPFACSIWEDCPIFFDTTGFIKSEWAPFVVGWRTKADVRFNGGQIKYHGPDSAKAI